MLHVMVWVPINLINIDNFVPCSKCFCYIYVQGERNSYHPLKMGEFPCASFYDQRRNCNRREEAQGCIQGGKRRGGFIQGGQGRHVPPAVIPEGRLEETDRNHHHVYHRR